MSNSQETFKKRVEKFCSELQPLDKLYVGQYLVGQYIKDMETEFENFKKSQENERKKD